MTAEYVNAVPPLSFKRLPKAVHPFAGLCILESGNRFESLHIDLNDLDAVDIEREEQLVVFIVMRGLRTNISVFPPSWIFRARSW
jgi:hypothetical protein